MRRLPVAGAKKAKPMEISELGIRIIERLGYGKANAITAMQLARSLGVKDERTIRKEITVLINLRYRIASSTEKPYYGYFLVNDEKEALEYVQSIDNRIKYDQLRKKAFLKANKVIFNPHQLPMSFTAVPIKQIVPEVN